MLNNPKLVFVTELEETVDVEFELVPVGVIRFDGALFLLIVGFYFLKRLPVKLIQVLDIRTDSQQHVRFKQVFLHVRQVVDKLIVLFLAVHVVVYQLVIVEYIVLPILLDNNGRSL